MQESKKGQVTVFIIIGIVILAGTGLLFLWRDSTIEETVTAPLSVFLEVQPIELYVQQCQKQVLEEALFETGKTGGFLLLPEHSTTTLIQNVPYYYDLGQDYFPVEEQFTDEIASYVDLALPFCLQNFTLFQNEGYTISAELPTSTVHLQPRTVTLITTLPLTISRGMQVRELSTFATGISSEQFHQNIQIARKIVDSSSEKEVCLTCFSQMAEESDIFVGIIPLGAGSYLFDLQDNNYIFYDEPYHLRFAVRSSADE